MKLKAHIAFTLLLSMFLGRAQTRSDVKEQVYVHVNSQTLLSGETLHLSAYCRSMVSGHLSDLSKILYVDIIGEKGSVHQQKVKLTGGRGEGEFFIPSVVPSGKYYLLAYTRWMTNFNDYFQVPLLVINPYEEYPNPNFRNDPKLTFPKDMKLVPGVENELAYHLKVSKPDSFSGKLVDDTGKEISKIKIDEFGIGSILFTPDNSSHYQILLSDTTGNVSFHPLPKVDTSGYWIDFNQEGLTLKVTISSSNSDQELLHLSLSAGGQEIVHQQVVSNQINSFRLDPSLYTMLTARVEKQNGKAVATRNAYVKTNRNEEVIKVDTFSIRSEVELNLDVPAGSYSVSVRRKLASTLDHHLHAVQHTHPPILDAPVPFQQYMAYDQANLQALMDLTSFDQSKELSQYVKWLPEVREEILTGILRDSAGSQVDNQFVTLTFPAEDYQLRVTKTNASGQFTIPFKSSKYDHVAVLSTIHPYTPYVFDVDEVFMSKYPDFDFDLPHLDSGMVARLLDRNIIVQLRNAYYTPPSLTTRVNDWSRPFQYDDQYVLDDYERFPTLKETFTEYIVSANIRENRDDVIQTTYKSGIGQSKLPPLVLLDGLPVRGADVFGLNPKYVHSVDIALNRLFLGPLVMDGVVDIGTKNHQLDGFSIADYHHEIEVMGIGVANGVANPEWLENPETRIPDLREQLLWISNIVLNSGGISVSFCTSDVTGAFEIIVEGFDSYGKPITKKTEVFVKQDLEL